ncbi:phage adaptor protein [Agrobacterium sp. CG674]
MALNTYDQIKTAVADYIMRPDAPIDSFIALGQSDVAPFIKHYLQEATVNLTTAANAVTLPADFQEARRVVVDGELANPTSIYRKDFIACSDNYYQKGKQLVFVPEKDTSRSVELSYYARFPFIDTTHPTNWLTENGFSSVIFHAALVRAYRWMKDKDSEAVEKNSLNEAIANVVADHNRATGSGNQVEIDFGGPLF